MLTTKLNPLSITLNPLQDDPKKPKTQLSRGLVRSNKAPTLMRRGEEEEMFARLNALAAQRAEHDARKSKRKEEIIAARKRELKMEKFEARKQLTTASSGENPKPAKPPINFR